MPYISSLREGCNICDCHCEIMAAIFRLFRSIVTAFVQRDRGPRDMTRARYVTGMYEMIGLVVYPIGLVAFVLLILIVDTSSRYEGKS